MITPLADTFAYCLMPNHYHFLIKISEKESIDGIFPERALKGYSYSYLISRQFANMLNGYAQACNKAYKRKGSLFMRPFKRRLIEEHDYFLNLIRYIHFIPVESGLCRRKEQWLYSSYNYILSPYPSFVLRNELIELLGSIKKFESWHSEPPVMSESTFGVKDGSEFSMTA